MTRNARDVSGTGIYHIMVRGIDKMDLFLDEDDRNRFLETLIKMKEKAGFILYGYCLMTNHVHILIKENKEPIGKTMKRIGVSYSYYFNRKYKRVGHLFQDRYRSEKIETEEHLITCLGYIHNNPVKASMMRKPEEHPWSSYRIYLESKRDSHYLVDRKYILGLLSENEEIAIKLFEKHSREGTEDMFIDYEAENKKADSYSKDEVEEIMKKYGTNTDGFKTINDKIKRDLILREIKKRASISIRDISRITGVSKDIIFRA